MNQTEGLHFLCFMLRRVLFSFIVLLQSITSRNYYYVHSPLKTTITVQVSLVIRVRFIILDRKSWKKSIFDWKIVI
jgi:hypothetical protein